MLDICLHSMRAAAIIILLLLNVTALRAQDPLAGAIDYPLLGISFTVPDGWLAQEGDGIIFIGSETVSGLILMSVHEMVDINDMKLTLESGFSDDGMELFPSGTAREIRADVARMEYTGLIEEQQARGMGYAMWNPHGNSISIIALALERTWTGSLETAAEKVMGSVVFRKPVNSGPSVEHWRKHLTNTRLTHIEGQNSPAAVEGAAGGGYSSTQRIDLCEGHFTMNGTGSVSVGADGVSGHASGETTGRGSWEVAEGTGGRPVLRLDHSDGGRSEFMLTEQEGKVFLNGERWFRTWEGEHAPDCE